MAKVVDYISGVDVEEISKMEASEMTVSRIRLVLRVLRAVE